MSTSQLRLGLNPNRRREILFLFLCLVLGFALRFHAFDRKSLWMDEIYTYLDSGDDFRGQIQFYEKNPTFLHPPLFFVLTHLFYPFEKPERDLRIIPVIFGTLSIPMFYMLAGCYSPALAVPCALTLTFMTYHVSLSQDGRAHVLTLFLAMGALYFLMRHLGTSRRRYLVFSALSYSASFYTSYSAIPFMVFSQLMWFYRIGPDQPKPRASSFLFLNGSILVLCAPWLVFLLAHYRGQPFADPFHTEAAGSFWSICHGILYDWVPFLPLLIASALLLLLLPLFMGSKRNGFLLLASLLLPVAGLSVYCRVFNVTHFVTSRYFIGFLPLFFVSLYLSLNRIELRFQNIRRWVRLTPLFLILFVASNLMILPLYYRSDKQDFRGLVTYLKGHLREGDKIFVSESSFIPAMLHYFGVSPTDRHYKVSRSGDFSQKETDFQVTFAVKGQFHSLHYARTCCSQYVRDGNRLWMVVLGWKAKELRRDSPCVLKGFFDGSFLNFNRFPTDASMYLFLWDPLSPHEKGIDLSIE